MTFVYARRIGKRLYFFADTRLSQSDLPLKRTDGCIKVVLVGPQLAVAFSNSPELAAEEIRRFSSDFGPRASFDQTCSFFAHSSGQTGNDYLIGHVTRDDSGLLFKASDGRGEQLYDGRGWIGDLEAFTSFRAFESGERRGPNLWVASVLTSVPPSRLSKKNSDALTKVLTTFELAIGSPDVQTAGDFFTVVTHTKGTFHFMNFTKLFFNDRPSPLAPGQTLKVTASGEFLDYRYTLLAPKKPGTNGCAFFYPHGALAYVFHAPDSLVANRCVVFDGCRSAEMLIDRCNQQLGLDLVSVAISH